MIFQYFKKNKYIFLLLLIFFLYFFLNYIHLLKYPPIWPDEAEYADIALNILKTGDFKTTLHSVSIFPLDKVYTYPPLLMYIFAACFKLFGFSITVQRMVAVIFGAVFLLFFYLFSIKILKNKLLALLPIFLLVFDLTFMKAAKISRPEIFIMAFTQIALFLIISKENMYSYILIGLFLGLSFIIQPYGIIGIIITTIYFFWKYKLKSIKKLVIISVPVFISVGWWFNKINWQLDILRKGMKLQTLRKNLEPGYFTQLLTEQNHYVSMLNLSLLAGSIFLVIYIILNKKTQEKILILISLLTYWFFIFIGKQFWYYAYPIPFIYLGYFLIIKEKTNSWRYVALIFIGLNLFFNTRVNLTLYKRFWGNSYSYEKYAKSIVNNIPNNSSVFISSIPDPFFELKKNTTLKLHLYPALPDEKIKYKQALESSDYIIYNGSYDLIYGNLLKKFIDKNKKTKINVFNGLNQYEGSVFRVKTVSPNIIK